MKKLKVPFSKLLFYSKLTFFILSDHTFRSFYFKTALKPNQNLDKLINTIRSLLRLNPVWGYGHYVLGILSYLKYRDTKEGSHKGTLLISGKALEELGFEEKYIFLLDKFICFIDKKFKKLTEDESFDSLINKFNAHERSLLYETRGLSNFILEQEKEALKDFKSISPTLRDKEVSSLISKLEGKI